MQSKTFLTLALAGTAAAQSLTDALNAQNSSLSLLNKLLTHQPPLVEALNSASNVTVLAPNNDALNAFLNMSSVVDEIAADAGFVAALIGYHVLNGTYYASNVTNASAFIPTMLSNQSFTNVTGGQVVEARSVNGSVTFFSGLKDNATVVTPNLNFTGGTIHIINSVLNIPLNDSATATAANLTSASGALQQAKLTETLDDLKDVTIFAPSNSAFAAIGNLVGNLSVDDLTSILKYHVIKGSVVYSPMVKNGTAKTLGGGDVTFTVENGTVYVNSAKVILADVLVSNGVVHVIDNVLNPKNTTATPNPSASTDAPAFSGASTVSGTPFTSGVATPTTTAPVATAASTSSGLGVPMKTGAVGAAALFGGAAILANW